MSGIFRKRLLVYRYHLEHPLMVRVLSLYPHQDFEWTNIYGLQIGPWFLGAIRGKQIKPKESKA